MRGKTGRKLLMVLLAGMLCLESVIPVYAVERDNVLSAAGFLQADMPEGMQPFDISEEAIAAAEVSEEEFVQQFGLDESDLEAAEAEMEQALGICEPVSEEVSANIISVNSTEVSKERAKTYATLEDAADYLRGKMVARKTYMTIRVAGSKDTALKNVKTILNKVFEYDINGAPNEGDYLYWHMKYMRWTTPKKNNDGTQTINLGFLYRTTASEERFVTSKVNAIVSGLNLKSASLNEYQKVRAIYDYVMSIIQYDHYHYETDQSFNYMYTAYEALNSGYAVCQAYATLFYRLCEEVGISARVICGNDDASGSPTHGWNIVKIGNYYYNLDATWDDADVPKHVYFLKNMSEFVGHQRNAVNAGADFDKRFPTAAVSYPIPEADVTNKMINVNNVTGTVSLIDGGSYSLTANDGRPKVLFFMNPKECSVAWLNQFYGIGVLKNGTCNTAIIDIYDGYTPEDIRKGKSDTLMHAIRDISYSPAAYSFSADYETGLSYRNQYAKAAGLPEGCFCAVVIIDANNRVRYMEHIEHSLAEIEKVIAEVTYTATHGSIAGISAVQTQNDEVKVTWNAYGGATGYRVYRKIGNGAYCCLGTTTTTTFMDKVIPKGVYTYRVCALYQSKEIASTSEKSVATNTILLKKGKTYIVDGYKYKVLKSTTKTKTVAFAGVSDKKITKVLIPDAVTINGMKYKVTEIAAKALKGNKKVKTVSIGANVTKIGKQAFYKAKKLANIVVKTKKLKSVGKSALSGISKKAEIRVPSAKLKKYKKLFAGKGQKSSVKIKK